MSYHIRKNFFKDYLWQGVIADTHVPPQSTIAPYDDKNWWFDPRFTEGDDRWYVSFLLWTVKYHGIHQHRFTATDPAGDATKKGIFIISGADEVAQHIQFLESAAEIPSTGLGGAVRPGFSGQNGAVTGNPYPGTQYEVAFGWGGPTQLAKPPTDTPTNYGPVGPFGISIYGDGGTAPTDATDGIHVHIVPENSFVHMRDSAGDLLPAINGSAVVVGAGTLDDYQVEHVTTFTTYNNGDTIIFNPDTEYFLRCAYWPEQENMKQFQDPNSYDGSAMRKKKLKIWIGWNDITTQADELHWKYVGTSNLIEFEYDSDRDYVYLFAYDYYKALVEQSEVTTAYEDAIIQFDQPTVASDWLPYDKGVVDDGFDGSAYSWFKYKKEPSELSHSVLTSTSTVPTFTVRDQIEVFAFTERLQADLIRLYQTDYTSAFPDGWTVTNTTGTIGQEVTPITQYLEGFYEDFTDKTRDPDWSGTAANWNTLTEDTLVNTGAGYLQSEVIDCTSDFVFTANYTFTGDGVNETLWYFGYNNLLLPNSILRIGMRASDNRIQVEEKQGGAFVSIDTTTAYEPEGTHALDVVRVGARIKVYLDTVLILEGGLITNVCTHPDLRLTINGTGVMEVTKVWHRSVFPDSYAYSTNIAGTLVDGQITRSLAGGTDLAGNHLSGYLDVTMWDSYQDYAGVTGAAYTKLHYDNGVSGTKWMGFGIFWNANVYYLYLHDADGSFEQIEFPTDSVVVHNTYQEHKFRFIWDMTGANITEVALYDLSTGETLGTITGVSHAYTTNMLLEHEFYGAAGGESPYYGKSTFMETPDNTPDFIESRIAHHEVRRINWKDSEGAVVLECKPIDSTMQSYSPTSGNAYESEINATDIDLMKVVLVDNGNERQRWFHPYNINTALLPGTWVPHRIRAAMWKNILQRLMEYSGLHWYVTPEMQFVVTNSSRNFFTTDVLLLGEGTPQGLYMHESEFTKSQLNWLSKVRRVDDDMGANRISDTRHQPVDFIEDRDPAPGGAHQMVGMNNAAAPFTTTTSTDVTRVVGAIPSSYPTKVQSTLGADNTIPVAVSSAAVVAMQTSEGVARLRSLAHNNQFPIIPVIGSKLYYRPLDVIEFKHAEWNPTVEDTTVPDNLYKYVVHRAKHTLHDNMVEYILGRMEEVESTVEINGLGTFKGGAFDGLNDIDSKLNTALGDTNL